MSYPTSEEWDEVARSNFAFRVSTPRKWFEVARDLAIAAEMLEPDLERRLSLIRRDPKNGHRVLRGASPHLTYLMIRSFELENLCKGVLASRLDATAVCLLEREAQLPRAFKNHDILKLLRRIGFVLDKQQERVASRLTQAAVWLGRYPTPTTSFRGGVLLWHGGDLEETRALVSSVRSFVRQAVGLHRVRYP